MNKEGRAIGLPMVKTDRECGLPRERAFGVQSMVEQCDYRNI